MTNYVTPYIPFTADKIIRGWRAGGKYAVVKAFEKRDYAHCPNCQDTRLIIIQLLEAGPYKAPPGHGVITWIDCEGMPKGWYTIHDTLSYECPECEKHEYDIVPVEPERALEIMRTLAEKKKGGM